MSRHAGWLAEQLPPSLLDAETKDAFMPRFIALFEDVGELVQDRIDTLPHNFDPSIAPLPMVRWLGTWMGISVDSSMEPQVQRSLVRASGRWLAWRGTRRGVAELVAELTGGAVVVADDGGVFGVNDTLTHGVTITVHAETTGQLTESQLRSVIESDIPAGATLALSIGALPQRG